MRPISRWAHMMASTVSIAARSSNDGYGGPSYGSPVSYVAHLSRKRRITRSVGGQEVVSEQALYLDGSVNILPSAQVTLSTADVGSTESFDIHPLIQSVERRFDGAGAHHVVVYL